MAKPASAEDPAQLSLFEEPPPAATAPVEPGQPPATAVLGPHIPAAQVPQAVPSPPIAAPPVHFRHPRCDRQIRLGEHVVGYALKRVRRRSIGFIVGTEGLDVHAPRWVSLRDIESALQAKGAWILRKLHEQRERGARLEASRIAWRDGTGVPFLGETVILVLDPRVAGAQLNALGQSLPGVPRLTLHVGLPQAARPEQIRDAVQSWLQRQALRVFTERCDHFAARLGVRMRRLSLSSAQTRWGSASADGSIRLNWRLVHFGLPVIDYVVAHELAHLREMNHSAAFWDVVRSVVPDFERAKTALKDTPLLAE